MHLYTHIYIYVYLSVYIYTDQSQLTQYDIVCHMRAMQVCFRNCIWLTSPSTWSISLTNCLHSWAATSYMLRPAISQTNPIKKKNQRQHAWARTTACYLDHMWNIWETSEGIRRHLAGYWEASRKCVWGIRELPLEDNIPGLLFQIGMIGAWNPINQHMLLT